jgi:transposase InsO family protein
VSDQRLSFVAMYEEGFSLSHVCLHFGISRPTGYKILERYAQDGVSGLFDLSRAPHSRPNAVHRNQLDQILALKARYPTWGPKKLKARLETLYGDLRWPAPSTIGEHLKRAGLVKERRLRPKCPAAPMLNEPEDVNRLWCIDYKGHFRLGNQRWCYPLTITDRASRFLIRCQALPDVTGAKAWPYFVGAFEEYGLPEAILSDNGSPFASVSTTGLTSLSLKLIRLGIRLERIAPGKPQQNGTHERLHRTLKAEAVYPVVAGLTAQQKRFDAWRRTYNEERPHEALAQSVPASVYTRSPRSYPRRMPGFQYPAETKVMRVRPNGCFRWRGREPFVSELLAGLDIALEPVDERRHIVYVGHQPVAVFDEADIAFLHPRNAAKYIKSLRQTATERTGSSGGGG